MEAITLLQLLESMGDRRPGSDATRLDLDWVETRNFHAAKIHSLEGLERFTSAREISLSQHQLSSLKDLGPLPSLEKLVLTQNELENLNGLAGCRNLRELDVSLNSLDSMDGVGSLPLLRELHAEHNQIRSIKGQSLPLLEVLGLSGNAALNSLDGLGDFPKLDTLYAVGCKVADWAQAGSHPSLKKLHATLLSHSDEGTLKSDRLEHLHLRLKGERSSLFLPTLRELRQLEIHQVESPFTLRWEALQSLERIQFRKCNIIGLTGIPIPSLLEMELIQLGRDSHIRWELFPKLRSVILSATTFSENQLRELRQHCPHATVIRI